MNGYFITFEGGEGAGKSTQIKRLKEALEKLQKQVVVTREPGGSPGAEEIRALLVSGSTDRWDVKTEALLMNAARRDHVLTKVKPALDEGTWVISDRFADSSTVYQGYAKGLDLDELQNLYKFVCEGVWPDLTFIFDLDPEVGLKRTEGRGGTEDRFEKMDFSFHKKLRAGFLQLAQQNPDRCIVIDASQDPDTVHAEIMSHIKERLFNHENFQRAARP